MDQHMNVGIAEQRFRKTAASVKPRQRSYYKKKGRQGRRTKLTGSLLGAINEIIVDTEILSISHLSQELLSRGHTLSRSTVFRAMEVLGLRVDRDKKVWCAGPGREQPGCDPVGGTSDNTSMITDEGFTKPQSNSTKSGSFAGRPEVNNFNYPQPVGYPTSNFQGTDDHVSSIEAAISENGDVYVVTNRQTKQEPGDSLNPVSRESECTGGPETVLLADGTTTAAKDGLRRPSAMPSVPSSQKRGRKRKSDCPSKFRAFHSSKICLTASNLPPTASAASGNGHVDGGLKGSSSAESQVQKTLPSNVNLPEDNQQMHVLSKSSVKAKESYTRSPGVDDYEVKHQEQSQSSQRQAGKKGTGKCPAGFESTADSLASPRRLMQPFLRDGLNLEPEAGDNGSSVIGNINQRNSYNATTKTTRAALDHESAGFVEWNNAKFVLRDRRLTGATLQDNRVPMSSLTSEGSGAGSLLHKSTPGNQRRQQSSSTHSASRQTEVMHGHQFLQHDSAASGGLNASSNSRHAKSEQRLGRQSSRASQFLASNDPKLPGLQIISLNNIHRETDPQTARLHALTSNLAAKTSKISEASSRARVTDGRCSDKLSPDRDSNPELSLNKNHSTVCRTAIEPQVTQTRQNAFAKSAIASANKQGASAGPHRESTRSQQTTCDAPASSQIEMNCFSKFLPELKSWMQDVSNRLNSMEHQMQNLARIIAEPNRAAMEADEKHSDEEETGDREAEEADDGNAVKEEDEEPEGGQAWDTSLPPINTPESNDMINSLLSDERWNSFSPYVGGTRLAIRLARDCIYGPRILSKSTVTGRNGMKPLQRDGIRKIKDCLMQIYGPKCSEVECEILWKMARESLSQLCKRTRRQLSTEANDNETEEQA